VDIRDISPEGWHVPSDTGWNELQLYLGMDPIDENLMGVSDNGISALLKETGTNHWESPNAGATNESGFTALPGGYRRSLNKDFNYIGEWVFFWTSSEYDFENAYFRSFSYDTRNISRSCNLKNYGYSIRCIKD